MEKVFGIDISTHQKGMDLAKAKAEGVKFVVLRGAYGTSKDKQFETHYKNAKDNDLMVGVYLYSLATTVEKAKAEANALIKNVLKGKQFELPIYFDIEDKKQKALTKRQNTDLTKAFCEVLEANGYYAGIYAGKSFLNDYLIDSELQEYAHWVAQWYTKCTYKGNEGVLGMWQFGGETNLLRSTRISNMDPCDQDYLLIDYPSIIKAAGLNGFFKSTETKVETPVVENKPEAAPVKPQVVTPPTPTLTHKVGDIVEFKGGKHYIGANIDAGADVKACRAKITAIESGADHPYHVRYVDSKGNFKAGGVYGWVDASTITSVKSTSKSPTPSYREHPVVDGDTLWDLAVYYLGSGTRYTEIKTLNGLKSDTIRVGDTLKIPNK